jgi:hypothetical protein
MSTQRSSRFHCGTEGEGEFKWLVPKRIESLAKEVSPYVRICPNAASPSWDGGSNQVSKYLNNRTSGRSHY